MSSVKEGGKENRIELERVRERACLDREKIPCRGSQSLKSSAKEGAPVLSGSNTHTHTCMHTNTHTYTPSRPFCYTWSPLSFLVPHTLTPPPIHIYYPPKRIHTTVSRLKHISTKIHTAAPCGQHTPPLAISLSR